MEINYIRSGDYDIPDLKLPEETRPISNPSDADCRECH